MIGKFIQAAAFSVLLAASAVAANISKPLTITVYGGNGNIGQRIVAEALSRGHQVTVVARNPANLKVNGSGLAVAKGDVGIQAAVAKQIAGQDVVISAINVGRGDGFQGNDFLLKAAQSLIGAMRSLDAKSPRLIVVGGAGSLEVSPGVSLMDQMKAGSGMGGGPMQQKLALDYYRTVNDVPWSYFSPAMQINAGKRTGKFRLGGDQMVKDAAGNSRISIEDYAVAMIDEAENAAHVRQRFTVGY
jgi:putative NADH-flavin reductase